MSNGYIVATEADRAAALDVAEGFGLDLIGPDAFGDATVATLSRAPNVGLLITEAAAHDAQFVTLMRGLTLQLRTAQLILASPEARSAFSFLPEVWPAMSLDEARARAQELSRRRAASNETPHAQPLPPAAEPEPEPAPEPDLPPLEQEAASPAPPAPAQEETPALEGGITEDNLATESEDTGADSFGAPGGGEQAQPAPAPAPALPPSVSEPEAPPPQAPPTHTAPAPPRQRSDDAKPRSTPPLGSTRGASSAPADATAFAPKKLRRDTPELVRIVIHQPRDLAAVIKAARKVDPRTSPAPSGMTIGDVALGASVGVSLEVRGAACDGQAQRRTWAGEPIDFNFSVEPDADVKQVVVLARVFVDDAQIGVLAFTRPVIGANKKPQPNGDKIRLKRHKRVFLSYSSKDRESVAAIATAYGSAGVEHFWDRASLKSGEEWSPRLRREIERADLFHLCWSKSAATSQWVEKETAYAITRRRRSNGKKPDITVQMLDGPPWAKHPESLDSINFDDFVRAAIVGYARGDGES